MLLLSPVSTANEMLKIAFRNNSAEARYAEL